MGKTHGCGVHVGEGEKMLSSHQLKFNNQEEKAAIAATITLSNETRVLSLGAFMNFHSYKVIGNGSEWVRLGRCNDVKKSQNYVKIVGFYRPSHSRPILTPGIQICSQKWSQVNISIGYSYISQVKILYKVKFSKLEICQSDCRFKILGKNY